MRVIRSVAASPIGRPRVSDCAAYSLASGVCSAEPDASAKSAACQAPGRVGSSSGRARSQAAPRAASECSGVLTSTSETASTSRVVCRSVTWKYVARLPW